MAKKKLYTAADVQPLAAYFDGRIEQFKDDGTFLHFELVSDYFAKYQSAYVRIREVIGFWESLLPAIARNRLLEVFPVTDEEHREALVQHGPIQW